ncbi:Metallo-peptidase family M12B Reprolysin-like-domain-containing protein, partial [Fomes fomentarius]
WIPHWLVIPHDNGYAIALVEKLEDLRSVLFLPLYFALSRLRTNLGTLDTGETWGYVTLICIIVSFSLGIIELEVRPPTCPSSTPSDFPWNVACQELITLNDRLSIFSEWRCTKSDDGAALWHLKSGCPTGSEVGIAWLATLCQHTASGQDPPVVSGQAVSTGGRTEWQVVAHEIGHNFGAICADGCSCANGCESQSVNCCPLSTSTCDANSQFIMSPVADTDEINFSPCSIGNICSLMAGTSGGRTNTSSIIDPNAPTSLTDRKPPITLKMCGNGIVEDGEDCDQASTPTRPAATHQHASSETAPSATRTARRAARTSAPSR